MIVNDMDNVPADATVYTRLVGKDEALYYRLLKALARAKELHPVFAEGIYQGIGCISEEMGELAQSVNHGEPEERVRSEAMDLLVVVWRFVQEEYKTEEKND